MNKRVLNFVFILIFFILFPAFSQDALSIGDNGYVGIGTDTPISLLNLHSPGSTTWLDFTSDESPGLRWSWQLKTDWSDLSDNAFTLSFFDNTDWIQRMIFYTGNSTHITGLTNLDMLLIRPEADYDPNVPDDEGGQIILSGTTGANHWVLDNKNDSFRIFNSPGNLIPFQVNSTEQFVRMQYGLLANHIAIGCSPWGPVPTPYETIQLYPTHVLRLCFGSTENFHFTYEGNAGANGVWVSNAWDLAEDYDVEDQSSTATVMTFSTTEDCKLKSTESAYEVIAGVISFHDSQLSNEFNPEKYGEEFSLPYIENRQPVALTGIVKCKVTNSNGEINRGDILVSSNMPGHAMKVDEELKFTLNDRYIVGVAMEYFNEETGMIWVQR